jgi:hypothetical protein
LPTPAPELRRLGLRFVVLLVVTSLAWALLLGPRYDRALTAAAIAFLHRIEPEPMTGAARVTSPYAVIDHRAPYGALPPQRLDLATIHDNVPLLVSLFLVTPGTTWRRRLVALAVAALALAATHVLHFALSVQWLYALENVGPWRVAELDYLARSFWQSLDHTAQTAKYLIGPLHDFYDRIGRLVTPVVLWMLFLARRREA